VYNLPAMKQDSSSLTEQNTPSNRSGRPVPAHFAVLFALAGALALWVVLPYAVPVFLGATLSVTLLPVQRVLLKLTRGRKGLASSLCTLLLLVLVVTPLISLVAYAATEIASGIEWAKQSLEVSNLKDLAMGRVPSFMRPLLERAFTSLQVSPQDFENVGHKVLEFGQTAVPRIFGGSLGALGGFFLADGESVIDLLMRLSPLSKKQTKELVDEFHAVSSASLMGLAFSAVSQCLVLTLGYWMAGVPHLFFFSVASFVSAFVPLVGAMLVWLPTALFMGTQGGAGMGVGLAVYSLVAVNVVDTGIKPMLLKGKMAMHGGLTFLSMLGGLTVFGPIGFIAGPLCIAFVTAFLRMYQRDYLRKGDVLDPTEA
jgi:predicted PurR-regulated permease PerM